MYEVRVSVEPWENFLYEVQDGPTSGPYAPRPGRGHRPLRLGLRDRVLPIGARRWRGNTVLGQTSRDDLALRPFDRGRGGMPPAGALAPGAEDQRERFGGRCGRAMQPAHLRGG